RFDVTLALGLLPWVDSPEAALREMIRVTRTSGYLIISIDNSWRLNYFLDPFDNPLLTPLRKAIGRAPRSIVIMRRSTSAAINMHSPRTFDRIVARNGLRKISGISLGFGPFTFLRSPLFSDETDIRLYSYLQKLADRKFPGLALAGVQYLVVAQKQSSIRQD